jgi:carbonic anhydrase/acetyltransferase-like protein (isoleucine patch superfamily)
MLFSLDERVPDLPASCYVAPTAAVIGDVHLGDQASIWFNAVIRGDTGPLRIGARSNIQDNSVIHTDEGIPFVVGRGVTVGHSCVLHGCVIGDNSLIGMGTTVLNAASIGRNCIIGANSLVTQGTRIPDNSLALGSPCKFIRELTDAEIEKNRINSQIYVDRAAQYLKQLHPLSSGPG